ncbi:PPOX class F420-dependent oxidoreductase [Mycobacterium sp. SMC-4]|uniref:PPOX class F420-dependent oxidoreductase n=1 Tax=Mycobacterium sp. SMC-4 TaxID=2857059 RepID=UPI003D0671D4
MTRTYATADEVTLPELLEFVRPRHRMVLTTFRAGESLQSSPVTGGVDAEGRIVIATYPQRAKAANIRRRPRASIVVLSDEFNGPYVQVDGSAEVIDLPDALEPLVEYFRVISGEHPDWDEYRAAMVKQGKCLIRATPQRWGPIATGGFPPPAAHS